MSAAGKAGGQIELEPGCQGSADVPVKKLDTRPFLQHPAHRLPGQRVHADGLFRNAVFTEAGAPLDDAPMNLERFRDRQPDFRAPEVQPGDGQTLAESGHPHDAVRRRGCVKRLDVFR